MLSVLLACSHAAAAAPCDVPAAPWISVEIVPDEFAGDEAAEFIEVDLAGCMTARFASFDVRAGVYQRALQQAEIATLQRLIETPALESTSQASLQKAVAHGIDEAQTVKADGSRDVFEVVCGDTHRVRIATGKRTKTLQWQGLREYAEAYPKVAELGAMVDVVDALRAMADPQRAKRIATVTP